ncbi:MAG: tRNA epoxyqueuosine(34) reductase QueG [Prevotella sp.]
MSSKPLNDYEVVPKDDLTLKIKAEAHRLGFFACGVAKADRVSSEAETRFRQWLEEGREADMEYMAHYTDKRLDPRLLMRGAKSIVCVALNYAPQKTIPEGQYQFAAYALGKDYHDIMKERLRRLATAFGFEDALHSERNKGLFRVFVDTGPLMERYWAQQAGLGWIGRNHQLIIPKAGSMFFLGELLLDVELNYDAPMRNHCGHCHRCVDACPTHAIIPYDSEAREMPDTDFDARRCLSYQLIENRHELSDEARKAMGDCIYGCDRCQQVCPWNRFTTPNDDPSLQPSAELLQMTKDDWRELTVEQYRRLFKGSAVKRAKYEGLMRNIRAAEAEDSALKNRGNSKDS